jgi:hypothetical protein
MVLIGLNLNLYRHILVFPAESPGGGRGKRRRGTRRWKIKRKVNERGEKYETV